MGKKRRRRGISPGSVLMIWMTVLVVAACAAFLLAIAGEDVVERTASLVRSLSEQGVFERAGEATPEPSAAPEAQMPSVPEAPQSGEEAEETVAPQAFSFTLAAAGTVYAPKAVRAAAEDSAGNYDFGEILSGLGGLLSEADLALATLETAAAGEERGYGSYNAPPELLSALRDSGVNVLSLATERALDKGYDGLELTLREMNSRALGCVGIAQEEGASGAQVLRVGGVQVAVLAYSYGLSDEGIEQTDGDERGAVVLIDEMRMVRDITAARLDGANVVIVMPHWGVKNRAETPQEVRELAVKLAEAGADVILGAHPNVVQGTERLSVTRSDGLTYEAAVCYSLGSLLTDARAPENTAGMVARLKVTYDPAARRVSLGDLACAPVYIASQREDGRSVYRVVDVENAAAMALLTQTEREAAIEAAKTVRDVTGQSEREQEGEG